MVVIKKLLQTQAGDHQDIIVHMAKLMDSIQVPEARAAILWVLGEYSERVPKVAPDVLRKMAKSFTNEDPQVKMQILNLATKLVLTNPEQRFVSAMHLMHVTLLSSMSGGSFLQLAIDLKSNTVPLSRL